MAIEQYKNLLVSDTDGIHYQLKAADGSTFAEDVRFVVLHVEQKGDKVGSREFDMIFEVTERSDDGEIVTIIPRFASKATEQMAANAASAAAAAQETANTALSTANNAKAKADTALQPNTNITVLDITARTVTASSTISAAALSSGSLFGPTGSLVLGTQSGVTRIEHCYMSSSGFTALTRFRCPENYNLETTSATPNVAITEDGSLRRYTSSKRFKDNIMDADAETIADALRRLRVRNFTSKCDGDDPDRVITGGIAEEFAEVDPALAYGRTVDGEYVIDGIVDKEIYFRLLAGWQYNDRRIAELEKELAGIRAMLEK